MAERGHLSNPEIKTQGNVVMITVVDVLNSTSLFYALAYAHPCRQISDVQAKTIASSLIKRSAIKD